MPEDYEAVYTHPGGATAVFARRDGSLDAVAKGLDSEQFWVFKNVKALLVRNDEGDLEQATRMMASLGFTAHVRELQPAAVRAAAGVAVAEPAPTPGYGAAAHAEEHAGHLHAPQPSYWPLILGLSLLVLLVGLIIINITPVLAAVGLIASFISMVGWGVEPFAA